MSQDFWIGFWVGGGVIGILGWFWITIDKYVKQAGAYYKPQNVVQPTSKTPAQVYADSVSAGFRVFVLRLLVLAYIIAIAAALSEDVRRVLMMVVTQLTSIFQ